MESNHQLEDSKSWSGESDRSEQASDDMGTGRSYECVFCKRGFTTAQALGGHMNIHRKDRAKTRPASNSFPSVSSKPADDQYYANLGSYQPIIQSNPQISAEEHVNYQTYFLAASSWSVGSPQTHHTDDLSAQTPQCLNLYGEDWRTSLSLQIGPSHIDDIKEKREGDLKEDDQLDLELRLGHNP